MIKSWLDYWNRPNGIFVNDRHKRAHYRVLLANIQPFLPRCAGGSLLDWGCGEAVGAELMAIECERVYLHDPASTVRAGLWQRYKDHPRITVLDDLKQLSDSSQDLILINSVVQYLSRAELSATLRDLRRLLKPEGMFLIGDVITPRTPLWRHAVVFLRFGYREGFFLAALIGLVRNFLPSYTSLKRKQGLSAYSEADLLRILEGAGLRGERLPRNIAVSHIRATYRAWITC
jgi:ubiquinone/menaquinone biosynthesis C-methylase UbiE